MYIMIVGWCITSSYMNCRVRADLPTPPLPTMMTLWTTGWLGVFLDAIFLLLLPLLTPLLSDGMLPNDELAGQWMPGSWWNRLRKLLSHLLPVSSTSGPDPGVTATAAGSLHCFCEGQANVKIFDWLRSSTSRRRWIACEMFVEKCDNEVRADTGHWASVWRIAFHLSLSTTSTWTSISKTR